MAAPSATSTRTSGETANVTPGAHVLQQSAGPSTMPEEAPVTIATFRSNSLISGQVPHFRNRGDSYASDVNNILQLVLRGRTWSPESSDRPSLLLQFRQRSCRQSARWSDEEGRRARAMPRAPSTGSAGRALELVSPVSSRRSGLLPLKIVFEDPMDPNNNPCSAGHRVLSLTSASWSTTPS